MSVLFKPQRHQGTKFLKHFFFVSLCLCGSTLLLSGCSLLGVGEAEYACPEPGKGVCKSARQVYKDTDTSIPAPEALPVTVKTEPDPGLVNPEAIPNRTPAQILRIWIAPWVDKQGNWHSGGVVMTDIYPREWQSAIPVYSPSDD
ncbi:TraV family lipoprotein [Endozoicomonas euniceicola]|uniref:TraV family lipoprotein n=1 Tax=Endozoicomonas euniceicola TaxID=1234143 RepID=A0ABY6GT72_9GAMM|nr:TraV family lipoprotein [Endozoicomonas euniceicola]UYM15967.1 TraV family lipoprotein [Endozoicomonas euniceicola]